MVETIYCKSNADLYLEIQAMLLREGYVCSITDCEKIYNNAGQPNGGVQYVKPVYLQECFELMQAQHYDKEQL